MKSWPTLVPLRHARFYAPKEGVFVTCCQLDCKGGVFCCANDSTVFGANALPASWTLKLTEIWGESKNNFGERSPPVCCPNYKTNSKGAFSGKTQKRICDLRLYGFFTTKKTEDPKKDNFPWQQYVLVLLMAKKTKQQQQQQQTDPHSEDKKKKQHELQMNIRNVYISVWNKNVSRIEYTP